MQARKSVVVGGGFVGLASALHLQRLGRRVTLVDPTKPGSAAAASYGNAGTMAAYANVPVNSPSVLRKLPSLLLDPTGPLSIKPSAHLASMVPWASLFAWNCRPAAVEHTAAALGALLSRAESGYEPVWEQAGVDIDLPMGAYASQSADGELPFAVRKGQGHLFLQRTEAAMKASQASAAMRTRHVAGLRMHALSQASYSLTHFISARLRSASSFAFSASRSLQCSSKSSAACWRSSTKLESVSSGSALTMHLALSILW